MILLDLTDQEQEFLLEILESRLGTLRQEVYHSETPAFKDELRRKKEILLQIIEKLRASSQAPRAPFGKAG